MNASIKLEDINSAKTIKFTELDGDLIKIDVQGTYHTEIILTKEQMKVAFRFVLEGKEEKL